MVKSAGWYRLSSAALSLAAGAAGVLLAWTPLASRFDNILYDSFFRMSPPAAPTGRTAVIGFDERTLSGYGGLRQVRPALARVLTELKNVGPKAVAVDFTLTDAGLKEEDAALAAAIEALPSVVLASEMLPDGSAWQDPLPLFKAKAAGLGHVGALPGPGDDINRRIPLERVAARARRWALSLEAFRQTLGAPEITSTPAGLEAGQWRLDSRWDQGRPMWIRYRAAGALTQVSAADVIERRRLDELRDKVIFIGVTALSGADDRLFTPLSDSMQVPGVVIHAHAFETLSAGDAPREVPLSVPVSLAFLLAGAAAAVLSSSTGWPAYLGAAAILLAAHAAPWLAFRSGWVLPAMAPATAAWIAVLGGASFQYFAVRRRMVSSEAATERYQKAFHFVAHEMRTPLTAIQGSSELISRYNLPEPKRKELGSMINSESKRLARMITTFLDVEKLSAGQMELRLARFPARELVDVCLARAAPLAERKQIRLEADVGGDLTLRADRELAEYALYNLITNAIKYSPAGSQVHVRGWMANGHVRLAVADRGIGMDAGEVKNLFRKFYRTKSAEASGEVGTGIGLSIVREIVTHHGGRVEVDSAPGQGSVFTIVLPAGETPR